MGYPYKYGIRQGYRLLAELRQFEQSNPEATSPDSPTQSVGAAGGEVAGRVMATSLLSEAHARCPNSKFILSGYSQGAWVMGAVARAATGSVQDAISSVVLFADPNGADKGGTLLSPSGREDFISREGTVDSIRSGAGAALLGQLGSLLVAEGTSTKYPIVAGGRYDQVADKVLHLCEPGDGVCDDVAGNAQTGYVHSYAYRGDNVVNDDGRANPDDVRKFSEVMGDRRVFDGAGNVWRSDWSMWSDTRVREWLEARS